MGDANIEIKGRVINERTNEMTSMLMKMSVYVRKNDEVEVQELDQVSIHSSLFIIRYDLRGDGATNLLRGTLGDDQEPVPIIVSPEMGMGRVSRSLELFTPMNPLIVTEKI